MQSLLGSICLICVYPFPWRRRRWPLPLRLRSHHHLHQILYDTVLPSPHLSPLPALGPPPDHDAVRRFRSETNAFRVASFQSRSRRVAGTALPSRSVTRRSMRRRERDSRSAIFLGMSQRWNHPGFLARYSEIYAGE